LTIYYRIEPCPAHVLACPNNPSASFQGFVQAAAGLDLPINRIALTHAHGDHTGSLDGIHTLLPEAAVAMAWRTAEFLKGIRAPRPDEPQEKLRGSFSLRATRPDRLLEPGETLGSLRVVASPGHTPDHIAFLDERDGTLIAGDAFQTQGGIAVSGVGRWRFPLPALATWHLPTALESAEALRQLDPVRLAVGHGRVLEAPQLQMDAAIAAARAKLHG
jgi:glyoxylase-like metal-dependent hydrolase (beta-lactamase superfamily II)